MNNQNVIEVIGRCSLCDGKVYKTASTGSIVCSECFAVEDTETKELPVIKMKLRLPVIDHFKPMDEFPVWPPRGCSVCGIGADEAMGYVCQDGLS